MKNEPDKNESVERLVSELVKSFKAREMYPAGHPARGRFLGKLLQSVETFLEQYGNLELGVRREGIQIEEEFLKTNDGAHLFLAEECFARQVHAIRLLRGFSGQDLDALFSLLAEDPEQVRAQGGASVYTSSRATGSLTVTEVDYSGILERRKETSTEKSSGYVTESQAPLPPTEEHLPSEPLTPAVFDDPGTPEVSLEDVLQGKLDKLDKAADPASYNSALTDIRESLRAADAMNLDRHTASVLRHLGSHLISERPEEILVLARHTVKGFSAQKVLEGLAGDLAHRSAVDRETVTAILLAVGEASIPALLFSLSEEEEAFARKAIMTILGQFGDAMHPYLLEWLDDERWYVLRNIIDLLSQIHSDQDSGKILPFLDHKNKQVRLAALRFITRHPTSVPEKKIQALLNDADSDVRARVIYAIGVLKGKEGLEQLFALAKKPAVGQGDVATRENAIKGIGRVGGDESIQFLTGLLHKRAILDPEGSSRVRKAAVEALAKIGGPRAASALRDSVRILKGDARRQAEAFLRKGADGE